MSAETQLQNQSGQEAQPVSGRIRDGVDTTVTRAKGDLTAMARSAGSLRIPELILGALLIVEGSFGLPIGINQIAMILLIGLAITRNPPNQVKIPGWVVALLVLCLFYVGVLSMFADPSENASDWKRRLIRLGLTALVMIVIASRRLDIRSILAGIGMALIVNIPLHYLGITVDTYGGYLTGVLEDKNVSGLAYAVYGVLLLALTRRLPVRFVLVLVTAGALWGTGSRTSMGAYAAALLWILVAPRILPVLRMALVALMYWAMTFISEDFSQVGAFSDREGSDLLRQRIDDASQIKVDDAGFFGMGLGEAYVWLEESTWYFHNSFWTALVEGGWPWLAAILALTIGIGLPLWRGGKVTRAQAIAQGATIVLLFCSFRLGEVLFTLPWALALAFALQARSAPEKDDESQAVLSQMAGGASHRA